MFGLTKSELVVLKKLSTPIKIQNFLDKMPLNWEKDGDTYMSPRRVLRRNKAHCLEGAMLAGLALWLHDEKPLLLDLKTTDGDDHIVTLFKRGGCWGAISKTNHSSLRYRDPIYRTVRELALSYFHEYYDSQASKRILRSYSKPFNLKKLGTKWITAEEELDCIAEALDNSPHYRLFPVSNVKLIRPPDSMERMAEKMIEWTKDDMRT
jgi:hypothetical protein